MLRHADKISLTEAIINLYKYRTYLKYYKIYIVIILYFYYNWSN